MQNRLISIVIPAHNEEANISKFFDELSAVTKKLPFDFEYIFVDDGSTDNTAKAVNKLGEKFSDIHLLRFSKNFGKEIAITAGIDNCHGYACILIDADLQHPPKYLPEFIKKWKNGAQVVVGIRKGNKGEGFVKKYGSKLFYVLINAISDTKLLPGSTDYRLIDVQVVEEFKKFHEHNRITRGLIDWMGFDRDFVYFEADKRNEGEAGYSLLKLTRLAFNGFISLSLFPLRLAGYLGITITLFSSVLGLAVFVAKYILHNSWGVSITGTASLALVLMFLIGIVLICLGLIALYIANIHQEVAGRPLYITRRTNEK